jgi:hypothetical protein
VATYPTLLDWPVAEDMYAMSVDVAGSINLITNETVMSIYHVKQIEHKVQTDFGHLIDMKDYEGKPEPERNDCLLSRSLAAHALGLEATVSAEVAASCITDGYDDNGIDAIYIKKEKENTVLFLVQAKWSKDGSASPNLDGVGKFIRGIGDLLEQKFDKFNEKIQKKKSEILDALLDTNCRIVAILVHTSTQKLGDHAQKEITDFCDSVNDTTEFLEFVNLDQAGLFKSLANSSATQRINLTIGLTEWGKKEEPYFAVYGTIDAEQVYTWWQEHQGRLFSKNLRGILGETTVNKEMRDTLEKHPEKFWYFNNGITLVAEKLKKGPLNATNQSYALFQCDGISVVNGAQTVSTIGRHFQKAAKAPAGVLIPVRIISVDSVQDLDTQITRANNTQNKIEGRDFAAIDDQQQRIKLELAILGVAYQLTRQEGFTPGERIFDVEEAIVALACAKGEADLAITAKREIGKFWENTKKPPYTDVIRSNVHGQHVFNAVRLQREIDSAIVSLAKAKQGKDETILIWGNRIIASIIFASLGSTWVTAKSNEIDAIIGSKKLNSAVAEVAELLINVVNKSYASGYIANTFKSVSKSKAIYSEITDVYVAL